MGDRMEGTTTSHVCQEQRTNFPRREKLGFPEKELIWGHGSLKLAPQDHRVRQTQRRDHHKHRPEQAEGHRWGWRQQALVDDGEGFGWGELWPKPLPRDCHRGCLKSEGRGAAQVTPFPPSLRHRDKTLFLSAARRWACWNRLMERLAPPVHQLFEGAAAPQR